MERLSTHETTSLGTYLAILRRRAWIVVICAILAPLAGYELAARETPLYSSASEVYINSDNIAAALTGIGSGGGSSDALAVDTQASLADVPAVAARALALAGIHDRSPGQVLAETTITPNEDTDILTFSVTDPSAQTAELLATSYARAFTAYSNGLESQPIANARSEVEAAMAKLQAQGSTHSALYTSLEEKDQQLQTLQTLQTSGVVLVRAAGPGGQVSPHPKRDAALGLILGLVLGLGLVFGVEMLDTRVRTSGDLSEGLGGLPLLARIPPPTSKMQKRDELAIVVQPRHNAAEAFRLLRTNLDFVRLSAGDVRTILVTSAIEKEGKSTTAANLAIAEARSGRRVALVDLDLRRPYIDRFFRLTGVDGMTDVALDRVTLDQALQPIDVRIGAPEQAAAAPTLLFGSRAPVAEAGVLDVIVSGPLPPDPGEFAASQRLAEILAQLRERYDTVIIDTPPLLWVGDAATLSSQADALILVARLKKLRTPMIREVRRILEVVPAHKLGFVITGPVSGEAVYGAGDAYAYGYGYGYGSTRQARPEPVRGGERLGGIHDVRRPLRTEAERERRGHGAEGER